MKKFKDIKNPEFSIKMAKEGQDLGAEFHVKDEKSFCDFMIDQWIVWGASVLDAMGLSKHSKEKILTVWCENIGKIIAEL